MRRHALDEVVIGVGLALLHRGQAREARGAHYPDLVNLDGFENKYPWQLSGGMQQRVSIARALSVEPELLLMDEPFGALDAQTRSKMQSYLLEIWRHIDITILFITHDLDEAIYLADRILVLDANPGRVNEVIEVPVPRPRFPAQFLQPEFLSARQRLDELIHPPSVTEEAVGLDLSRFVRSGEKTDAQD